MIGLMLRELRSRRRRLARHALRPRARSPPGRRPGPRRPDLSGRAQAAERLRTDHGAARVGGDAPADGHATARHLSQRHRRAHGSSGRGHLPLALAPGVSRTTSRATTPSRCGCRSSTWTRPMAVSCWRLARSGLGALPVRVRDVMNDRRNANEALEIDDLDTVLARHAALPVPAAAGDALVFHTFLLHRSQPNRSAATRWTLQARYFDFLNPTAIRHDWVGRHERGRGLPALPSRAGRRPRRRLSAHAGRLPRVRAPRSRAAARLAARSDADLGVEAPSRPTQDPPLPGLRPRDERSGRPRRRRRLLRSATTTRSWNPPTADDLYDLGPDQQPIYRSQIQLDNLSRLANLPAKGRLLDFGCGKGAFLARFQHQHPGWELSGSDVSERYRAFVEPLTGPGALPRDGRSTAPSRRPDRTI